GDVSVNEGDVGTTNAVFTVVLSAASTQTVSVQFNTTNGTASAPSDYQSRAGTLTFHPGDTIETITIPINGDGIDEPNETFFVNLGQAVNAGIADGSGTGTIVDDDTASALSVSINDVSVLEGDSRTTTAIFNVMLSLPSTQTVIVRFAT